LRLTSLTGVGSSRLLFTSASGSNPLRPCHTLLLDKRGSVLAILSEALRLVLLDKASNTHKHLLLLARSLLTQLPQLCSVLGLLVLDELFEVGRHD